MLHFDPTITIADLLAVVGIAGTIIVYFLKVVKALDRLNVNQDLIYRALADLKGVPVEIARLQERASNIEQRQQVRLSRERVKARHDSLNGDING